MPKFKSINNNFTSGKISQLLAARIDFPKVQHGLESINNFKVLVEGGLTVRPGSKFSVEVKDSSKTTVLIDFDSGLSGNYSLEFGDLYMRVHKIGGIVVESDLTITGITKANPAVVTSTAHGLSDGDQVYITGVEGMTEINDFRLYYTVANKTANTFEVQDRDGTNVDSSAFTTYTSAGVVNKIFEIVTPYVEGDLEELNYTQNQDVLTISHNTYATRDFARTSDTDWTITAVQKDAADPSATLLLVDGPYLKENRATTTLVLSGTGATATITASSIVGINGGVGFKSTDLGRLIRWHDGTDFTYYEITTFTSTTVVTGTLKGDTPADVTATIRWRLGAWSDTTGFPALSIYFQQRQWFFRTTDILDRIDGSKINDFVQFTPSTDDDEAIEVLLASKTVNAIFWAAGAGSKLRLGTSRTTWTIWGGSDNTTISPLNVQARIEDVVSSKNTRPIDLASKTLFLDASGKKLHELSFSFENDALITKDLTRLSDDILGDLGDTADTGIKRMAYQETPYPSIWAIKNDGGLVGLTYAHKEDVVAWSSHPIGGTDVEVKSISSIFDNTEVRILLIVKRTIDGVTRQYVEQLDTVFRGRDVDSSIFFDSAVVVEGDKPATTLTLSATSGDGVTATAGAASFVAADVGRVIRSGGGRMKITGFTSTTVVVGNANDTFATTSIASGDWNLSISSVSGLGYLEGQTIQILGNGGQLPSKIVSNGIVNLGGQYNKIVLGLDYPKNFRTVNIEAGSALGTNIGSRARVINTYVSYFETVGGRVGFDSTETEAILKRSGTDEGGKGIEPETGIRDTTPPSGWENTIQGYYEQPNGLPSTITGMTFKGEVND